MWIKGETVERRRKRGQGRRAHRLKEHSESGEGETKIPMFIGLIGTLLNLILDPIFIFVLEYGVKGAALATVISQAVMVISYLFVIFVRKKGSDSPFFVFLFTESHCIAPKNKKQE